MALRPAAGVHAFCILLVEDNPGDARLVVDALADTKEAVAGIRTAGSLTEALEILASDRIQLILLDLNLPDTSGLETLQAVRSAVPQLPIIVLTGLEDEATALEAMRMGAQDYLTKSEIGPGMLARTLRHVAERSRLQKVESFISRSAQLLGSTLDMKDTLGQLAKLTVENLADFCAVDLYRPQGELERLLVAFRDPGRAGMAERLEKLELDRSKPHLTSEATAQRSPVLIRRVAREHLDSIAQNADHRQLLEEMQIRSYMAVPLMAQERLVGVLLLISSSWEFTEEDLELAVRFATMAAVAVNNARLYEDAAEALRARDRVLGVVAHDLRNPLSTISMSAELLLENVLNELQSQHQLQIIRRSADRMNRLIQDLLDVARIEHGRLVLDLSYRDPEAIVREVLETNSSQAAAHELKLKGSFSSYSPVSADYNRLMQVMSNLVGNALKFTPSGGTITVGVEEVEKVARFFVQDTGPGMAADEMEHLFQPFWQGRARGGEGAGLGLSIARGIIEAHGGRIWAESQLGDGTTMFFTLPVAEERRVRQGSAGAGKTPH